MRKVIYKEQYLFVGNPMESTKILKSLLQYYSYIY